MASWYLYLVICQNTHAKCSLFQKSFLSFSNKSPLSQALSLPPSSSLFELPRWSDTPPQELWSWLLHITVIWKHHVRERKQDPGSETGAREGWHIWVTPLPHPTLCLGHHIDFSQLFSNVTIALDILQVSRSGSESSLTCTRSQSLYVICFTWW